MAKPKRKTFRMCNIPCQSVNVSGWTGWTRKIVVDIDNVPLASLDDILDDVSCREIADWLLDMDASDYMTIMELVKKRFDRLSEVV